MYAMLIQLQDGNDVDTIIMHVEEAFIFDCRPITCLE